MSPDFFDPPLDELDIIPVVERTIAQATRFVVGCESCTPEEAEFPFDWVLDYVTGRLGSRTNYVLETPAKCPNCRRDVLEKTLVDARWSDAVDLSQESFE